MKIFPQKIAIVLAFLGPFVITAPTEHAFRMNDESEMIGKLSIPKGAEIIPNEYIIQLKRPDSMSEEDVDLSIVDEHLRRAFPEYQDRFNAIGAYDNSAFKGTPVIHKYEMGYAARLDENQLERIQSFSDVEMIEANQVVHTTDFQEDPQNWGLDRISHRDLPLHYEYLYNEKAGEGVDVYVIDTGVNIDHEDFEGRAEWGYTAPEGDEDADGNGHGTHVASTIAGKEYGVAKKAHIIAVKVLRSSGYGSMSDVLKGVEWAADAHKFKDALSGTKKKIKSVANMSLGGGRSFLLDRAIESAIAAGVQFAVAAGNDNSDACNYSPARAKSGITVGSITSSDRRSYFSNYGNCVDVFAPGSGITAAWIGSKTAIRTISGTSMASPHVCGVMALIRAQEDEMSPFELKKKLLEIATPDHVASPGYNSPNLILYNGGSKPPEKKDTKPKQQNLEVETIEIFVEMPKISSYGEILSKIFERLNF